MTPNRGFRAAALAACLLALLASGCEQTDVTVVEVSRVEVSPPTATITVNATAQLNAEVLGEGGVHLSGRSISWSSQDPAIARVDGNGLVTGVAAGSTQIEAVSEGARGTATVAVVLRTPVIAVDPDSVFVTATQGAGALAERTVTVTEANGGPLAGLSAEVSYAAGEPVGWVSATIGATTTPAQLTLRVNTGALSPGTYRATLRISAPGAANTPQLVPIVLVIQPRPPALALSRTDVTLATATNGSDPAPVPIDITNAGAGTLSGLAVAVSYAAGQPTGWLTAQLGGTTAPTALTLSAARGTLPVGTYTATVRLTSTTAVNSPVDVTVTFVVATAPPGAPSALVATAVSPTRIDLAWTAAAGEVTRYRIERRSGAGAFALVDSVAGSVLAWTDGGLAPATTYTYRVQACNVAGCSAFTPEAGATTPVAPPGAPSALLVVTAFTTRIDLAWTASTGTVDRYRIERAVGTGAFAVIDSVAAGTTSYSDTGLSSGVTYGYRVQACNAGGCSAYSNVVSAMTGTAPPGVPSGLQAAATSSTQIEVSWSQASGSVNTYQLERSTAGGAFAPLATLSGGTTSYPDTGLTPATTYTYRIRACNVGGCSGYSATAAATTGATAPSPPSGLTAAATGTRIDLAWTAATGVVQSYRIERRLATDTAFSVVGTVGGTVLAYSDSGLAPSTAYTYRVRACNTGGCSAPSNAASATTGPAPPDAPTGLQATAASSTRINLTWTAPTGAVDSYQVERKTGDGAFASAGSVSGSTTTFADNGLPKGTTFTYRVRACNAGGCSGWSNEASATTSGGG